MKNNKLLTSLFVLGMGLSLVACGASDGGTTTKTDGTKTVEKKSTFTGAATTIKGETLVELSPTNQIGRAHV